MDNISINTSPIGFFDSGVGGLSVLASFREQMPKENIIYFGDTIHLPYGNKSKEELIGYARNILNFMRKKSVKAVVIACNTSSAQAYDSIKNEYNFPVYPIIQSCVKSICQKGYKRIGVFATEATVNSEKYSEEFMKINPDIQVKEMAAKNWVGIVEKNGQDIAQATADIGNEIARMLSFNPDKIILGCTHYPYLMSEFIKYAPQELFIDPAEMFAAYIKNDLKNKCLTNSGLNDKHGSEEFFVSSKPEEFIKNAKIFYSVKNCMLLEDAFAE